MLYQLPCHCQGSMALVHDSCFCRFMEWRYKHTGDVSCDVCRAPFFKPVVYEADVKLQCHFFQMLYQTLSFFLYYLLFLMGVFVHWVANMPTDPVKFQFGQAVCVLAVFACLQPSVVVCIYILVALHHHTTTAAPPPLHTTLSRFLQDHATRVA
jgi:hypothetical protein